MGCDTFDVDGMRGFICGPGFGPKKPRGPQGPTRQVIEHAAPYRSEPRWRDVLECGHAVPSKPRTYPKTRRCKECLPSPTTSS